MMLKDLDVANKKVLVRVDFNVPLDKEGNITDDTRIQASLPTIQYLLTQNAAVILVSHLGRPKGRDPKLTLEPCRKRLSELLQKPVSLVELDALPKELAPGSITLIENIRFFPAEEKPELDPTLAKKLASVADCYVNDAFGTAHRAHSSTATVAGYFPPERRAAGFLLEKEIAFIGNSLSNPKRPFFAIIGGAKVSTKIGVLRALVTKVDVLMLGGSMAYTFFKAQGIPTGDSPVEDDMLEVAKEILKAKIPIYLPLDIIATTQFDNNAPAKTFDLPAGIPSGYQGMDIGPKTVALWKEKLQAAKTVLWNGPVGVFEFPNFAKGTSAIAQTLATLSGAITIVGGGDSVAAVQQANLADKMSHLSTGGGATLEYVEFGTLPGIDALG